MNAPCRVHTLRQLLAPAVLAGSFVVAPQVAVSQLVRDCPKDVFPDFVTEERVSSDEERAELDEFAAARATFEGLTAAEFETRFASTRSYIDTGPPGFVRGETNGDGVIDIADPVCILFGMLLGEGPCAGSTCPDAQDVDDSGVVDVTDPIYLLRHLFLGGAEPPAPFQQADVDPTSDDLPCSSVGGLGYDPMESQFLDAVFSRYFLGAAQERAFRENGFVILDDVRFETFFHGLHELWMSHMPVYVSVDTVLDALHVSLDRLILSLEEAVLIDELEAMLVAMEGGLGALDESADGLDMARELDDVAVWIATARSLLAGEKVSAARPVDSEVDAMLARVASETLVKNFDLFGMEHCVDFSHFKPRGHYTRSDRLKRYFRAMMWVQRIGLKFAQNERHARVALLLSRLLRETGAIDKWNRINAVVETLVGNSDSLNPPGLLSFVDAEGLTVTDLYGPAGFERFVLGALEQGLGKQRIRSQIVMSNSSPDSFTPNPPAFHLMGQRFVVDSYVFSNVVFDVVRGPEPYRHFPTPLDAWFALGNRATVPLLRGELERWETHQYPGSLAAMEWLVSGYPSGLRQDNIYNLWLGALQELDADTTAADYPPVMRTETWERRMLQTQLASWSQLRHATVLYPKPSEDSGAGCDYPHGWVDPYPAFFDRLAEFAATATARFGELELLQVTGPEWGGVANDYVGWYLSNLEESARQLAEIARAELASEELTEEQHGFLRSLVHDDIDGGCTWVETFDGWYPRMIYGFDHVRPQGFDPSIVDVHTSVNTGGALHVGTGYPNLMLISVQNECGPRAYVGPVLSYHEFIHDDPPFTRLSDEEWRAELETGEPAPRPAWVREFVR